jgi:hypothetical protein
MRQSCDFCFRQFSADREKYSESSARGTINQGHKHLAKNDMEKGTLTELFAADTVLRREQSCSSGSGYQVQDLHTVKKNTCHTVEEFADFECAKKQDSVEKAGFFVHQTHRGPGHTDPEGRDP